MSDDNKLRLAKALSALESARKEIDKLSYNPIAIIGMSCRFPGGANSVEEFWQLLEAGFDSSIDVPKSRWDIDTYYDPNPDAKGKMVSRKSSFMTIPIEEFDADFFGISPREAEYLDPQQRLLLEVTWEALEEAGISPKSLKGTLTGVFIGISSNDYRDLLSENLPKTEIDAYYGTGNAASTATGRISYTLGLQGPSFAVDTACSSSLVALHEACLSLRNGDSDIAIAGGVNVLLSPTLSIDFSQAHMLAADGHCKTFDKDADGYVRGEGCGIIILKRLSDALHDNDKILGVIKGSAVNQDGASSGLTVPNGPAQETVIKRALVQAKLTAADIDYIEVHGTGTALGDPIEFNALAKVFKGRDKALTLGTVKTNIGHLEAAAGIAGVIKTLLALQHEKIPRHLHFKEINPSIDLAVIPAQIPLQAVEWKKQSEHLRRAGISSFGFSGTNAHIIIEEAPAQDANQIRQPLPITLFNRKRYWVEALTHKHKEKMYGEEVHPLLGYRIPANANQTANIIYEQQIDRTETSFQYLLDHTIYDHVIYPATGYIELLLRGAKSDEHSAIALSTLSIERPLALNASITVMEVVIDNVNASIYSQSSGGWLLHSTAAIDTEISFIESESLSTLQARINTEVPLNDFYTKAKMAGIAYGPNFQVIKKAKVTQEEALLYLETHSFDSRYLAYPPLVDGALQGLGLLSTEGLYLPVSCEHILWQQVLPLKVVAHLKIVEKTPESIQADINFYDNDICILQLKGFRARRVSKNAFLKMLVQKEEKLYYEPVWDVYTPQLGETSREALVYDARIRDKVISVIPALSLLSYLQKQLSENIPVSGLHIITENAYGNNINLNQSSLNGLIKTAILEHPELHIRQLDVTQDVEVTPLLEIVAKDLGPGQILQFREEKWLNEHIIHQQGLVLPNDNYRLVKSETGIIEQLALVDEEPLNITDNEILIEPFAVGLNFRDVLNAMNLYPGDPGPLGGDVAGIIKVVGKNITGYQVGDEVVGLTLGSLASQAITKEALITLKPKTLQFSEAATIPTVFMTAYLALVKLANLKAGETILIHAGTGGVGLAAVQIAQYCKAKIIATAGSENKRAYLRSLGIEHVFDSRSLNYKDDILRINHNRGVDVVLNSLSGKGFIEATLESAAEKARFVEIGKRDIWSGEEVHSKRDDITYHILALDQLSLEDPEGVQELLQAVMQLFEKQILKPIPQTSFPLSQAVAAFKYLQQAKQIGKVVITLPPAEIEFKGNATYLITGGLGGVGLEVANYLSEHGAKRIILTGRHAPTESATSRIENIRAKSIEVVTALCDVSDPAEINKLINDISTKEYPLKGIFHLAGIIEDAPLDKQTETSFINVFSPKALGAWNLHETTKDMHLDYFVLFSSTASLMGSPAQSNYAAANSFLDALAAYRQQQGLTAESINWGPWREVGMAKDLVNFHERQGMQPLRSEEALIALTYALKQGLPQIGIIHANWKKISESISASPSWLDKLIEQKSTSDFIKTLQGSSTEQREALLKQTVTQTLQKILGQTQALDESKGFFEMGMDSLMALELKNHLQALLGISLSNTLAFDYPTLNMLIPYLASILKIKELPTVKSQIQYLSQSDPIAIIGMSCRFPGGANSPDEFWQLLEAGFDSSIEVPKSRWNIDFYYDPDPDAKGKMVSRKSSFMTIPIDEFDADFFGISPREAELLDPQQRLLLEVTWEALEDARVELKSLNRSLTGVFIGISSHDYEDLLTQSLPDEAIDAYLGTGNAASTATGRISYTLGLQGPSLAIDTACSSSLVALHEACLSLRNGDSDLAIAGGVNVILSPKLSIDFSQAHMLAADGHCKTFDKNADGYVRGEGCGIIILKRLSDAVRENDRILGVIKGSAVNQDGTSGGLTVPNGPSQESVILRALQQAKIQSSDIDYIEAHGTGTALGDPIEFNALTHVFKGRDQPLTIGTVKTNIGHLEAAAGIAGIIKTLLALQHEKIPRHLHFKEINPSIDLAVIPAQIPLQAIEWKKQPEHLRRAGISSFGFSGTNAHIIIEEAPKQDASQMRQPLPKTLFNRQRYWDEALTHKHKEKIYSAEIHPLLGYRIPANANQTANIYEQQIDVTEASFQYLLDHSIYDHVIYPASGYLELLLSGVKNAERSAIALSGLSIERSLALNASITVMEVVIDNVNASIYSQSSVGWLLQSKAVIDTEISFIKADPLSTLEARINTEVPLDDFYAKAKMAGIAYGPRFQVIKKAKVEPEEALLYLETHSFDSRYLAYPPLVDGGLQGIGLLNTEGLYLPVSCEHIHWQQTLPAKVVAHVRIVEKTPESIQADINFYDSDICILQLKGFRAHRVNKNAFLKMLAQKEEKLYYEPVWDVYSPVLEETAKEVLVYDARTKTQNISVAPALSLLSYLQKQLSEDVNIAGLHIITENAYGNTINLNQSSLNGLIKTAILEHPELHIRQVDVTQDVDVTPLLEIVAKDSGPAQILQYREEKWLSEHIAHQPGLVLPESNYRLVKSESGIIEQLALVHEGILTIADNEILITPLAVGLNFRDILNAMNLYPGDPGPLGGDVSGIIKAVGKNITHYQVGDEVVGLASGSLSSQAITQEALITLKLKTLQFSEAATIPTVFMTAYLALVKLANLKENETILIHAGTGGVGLAAIQIAHYCKAKIIATAGSEKKREYLRSLGVEHVFDSRSLSYKDDILRVTNNRGVDVVLNSLSGKGFIEATLESSAEKARFVEIGKRDIWNVEEVHSKRDDITYHILALDQLSIEHPNEVQELLQAVMQLFEKQILKPIPQTLFPLTQAIDAFKYLQQAKQIGKVVITLPPAEIEFKGNATYLITGGLGGVGLEVANYLREKGAKRIILTGRHAPTETAVTYLQEIRTKGTEVVTLLCDVSVPAEINKLIKDISIKDYPLKGVFHLAGIIEDAPLDKQTEASFMQVFSPKALGAWNLHAATKDMDLDYFVLFSSTASLNGSPGQSNYAAANSFLDALAAYRQQQNLIASSINWGPWRDVGMAKDLVTRHERQGMKPLGTTEALAALTYALKQSLPQLGIFQADWKKISENQIQIPSWLDALINKKQSSDFINILQAAPRAQRETLLKQAIIQEVKKVLGQTQALDESKGFFEMGMDSLMALELKNHLQALLGIGLPNTLTFDYPTIETLIPYLANVLKITELQSIKPPIQYLGQNDPIAIIGMSCRFPGAANSPDEFWQLLEAGFDSSIEVPKSRWDIDTYYDPDPDAKGKMVSRKSSFMTIPIDEFDADFFGISPREAEYLDPQQRLLLEVTWEALENARIEPKSLNRSLTGVFIGISSHDYEDLLTKSLPDEDIDAYLGTGNAASTATGRVSYTLGLQGPSLAVDTACSSSLVALHEACLSLRNGDSDLAIAGGVNVILSPTLSIDFSQAHMLAADGHCKTFDKDADGYVRGEGCGIIILKRLSDALHDNDKILGVIKGSAVNQDGASSGLTVPNGPAQETVIKRALAQAKLTAADIDYIEVHGTGTALGDPIEFNALAKVFKGRDKALTIGTVKTNIGHLEAAAGIAGIIKTLLALQHEKIPRHLHFKELNPSIDLAIIPAQIPLQAIDWKKRDGKIRRAGVSSFGFSGTNAHIILQEAPTQDLTQIHQPLPKTIFNRQRYWPEALTHKSKKNIYGKEVHPLLGYRLGQTVNQNAIIYEQEIDLTEVSLEYLHDHTIYDHVIYPATGYIEILLRAGNEDESNGITLSAVSIERPLELSAPQTLMEVALENKRVSVYSKSGMRWILHSTAEIGSEHTLIVADTLSILEQRVSTEVNINDFYVKAKTTGIVYGPAFQVITKAKIMEHEALVYLETCSFDSRYLAYPALVDGGLQGLGLFGEEGLYLPVSCEQIHWQQALPAKVVAHVMLIEKTHEGIRADVDFYADEICMLQLKGFQARRVSKNTFLKMLAQREEKLYYEPVWDVYTPELGETSQKVLVYDARAKTNEISIEPAITLLSYLQKQIKENAKISGLNIITENAYADNINLNQSALNGLIKTAILEHPELHIRQIDVTADININPLLELLSKDTGTAQILQYRDEKWLAEHVMPQQGLTLPSADYRLVKSENGIIEQLALIEEETRIVADNELLIAPKAVGLNFRDVLNAMNLYPGDPGHLGGDVAGVIKAVGNNITRYQVGDEVVGLAWGSLSSQAVTQESLITLKPQTLQFSEAATIPTVFMTAYLALVKLAKLKAEETVLIHAGTGGVGLAAIQIAQYCKANIIATAGSEQKRAYLRSLGLEHVFDSRSLSYKDDILRVTNNRGVDVVLNSLSGKGFIEATLESAAEKARFVEIGKRDIWSPEEVDAKRNDITYHILALDQLSVEHPDEVQELLQAVMQLFEKQTLKPIPQTLFPLAQSVAAFKYLQQAKQIGKVVITMPPAEIEFKGNASYLITGGLGGVGLEVAHYLSENGAKRIILTSRHAPTETALTPLQEIHAKGTEIVTLLCDVSVSAEINKLIKDISTKEYPLKGIFHLAGIIEDASLDQQTEASFTHVFEPKAFGAWNLHEATKDIDLDYFVLFSSTASLMGSPGQSNYASANSFLDALAVYRQQEGLAAESINWGPWRDVGMAKELVARHERQGMKPLGTAEALFALTHALKQSLPELGIMQADWKKISDSYSAIPSWLDSLLERKQGSDFIKTLEATPPEQREKFLKETIIQEIKKVLGQSQPIDENKGFFEMGMDSLMAMELKNKLQVLVELTLPNTIAFDYPKIDKLVAYLISKLNIPARTGVADIETIDQTATNEVVHRDVDSMTEDEIIKNIENLDLDKLD